MRSVACTFGWDARGRFQCDFAVRRGVPNGSHTSLPICLYDFSSRTRSRSVLPHALLPCPEGSVITAERSDLPCNVSGTDAPRGGGGGGAWGGAPSAGAGPGAGRPRGVGRHTISPCLTGYHRQPLSPLLRTRCRLPCALTCVSSPPPSTSTAPLSLHLPVSRVWARCGGLAAHRQPCRSRLQLQAAPARALLLPASPPETAVRGLQQAPQPAPSVCRGL